MQVCYNAQMREPTETTFQRINRDADEREYPRPLYSYRLRDGGHDHSTVESMAMLQGYTDLQILDASSEGVYFEPVSDRALREIFSTRITSWRKKEIIQFSRWLRQTAETYKGRIDPVGIANLDKRCSQCNETFPNDAFYFYPKRAVSSTYLRATCRRCENVNRSERRRRAKGHFD